MRPRLWTGPPRALLHLDPTISGHEAGAQHWAGGRPFGGDAAILSFASFRMGLDAEPPDPPRPKAGENIMGPPLLLPSELCFCCLKRTSNHDTHQKINCPISLVGSEDSAHLRAAESLTINPHMLDEAVKPLTAANALNVMPM